jgi:hypothetical protein
MKKAATERYAWARPEEHNEKNSYANPRVDTEIVAGIGKRKGRARNAPDAGP